MHIKEGRKLYLNLSLFKLISVCDTEWEKKTQYCFVPLLLVLAQITWFIISGKCQVFLLKATLFSLCN